MNKKKSVPDSKQLLATLAFSTNSEPYTEINQERNSMFQATN